VVASCSACYHSARCRDAARRGSGWVVPRERRGGGGTDCVAGGGSMAGVGGADRWEHGAGREDGGGGSRRDLPWREAEGER
jgi:hypothetical protein